MTLPPLKYLDEDAKFEMEIKAVILKCPETQWAVLFDTSGNMLGSGNGESIAEAVQEATKDVTKVLPPLEGEAIIRPAATWVVRFSGPKEAVEDFACLAYMLQKEETE